MHDGAPCLLGRERDSDLRLLLNAQGHRVDGLPRCTGGQARKAMSTAEKQVWAAGQPWVGLPPWKGGARRAWGLRARSSQDSLHGVPGLPSSQARPLPTALRYPWAGMTVSGTHRV